jgi:hypothetical protein
MTESARLLLALLCIAVYSVLFITFLAALENRRFNMRIVMVIMTAAAVTAGLLAIVTRAPP